MSRRPHLACRKKCKQMPSGFKFTPRNFFFDAPIVIRALDAGWRYALTKVGAYLRTRMKSGMCRRKRSAKQGEFPSVHAGQLRDLIYFGLDGAGHYLDVGPVRFRKGQAPELNEFGGKTTNTTKKGQSYSANYEQHPFAAPSLKAETDAGTIPQAWASVVKN